MKIVVPVAGRGSRFANRGIATPKPLIPVAGCPMVTWALKSLDGIPYTDIVFVALAEHEELHNVSVLVHPPVGASAQVILLDNITEGQLCTVLAAREVINRDEDLLIASADTYVVSDLAQDISQRAADCMGIISVANMSGDRWSFARTDVKGRVVKVAEKVRISDHACTGLYYFANGQQFVEVAEEMIRNKEKTRGEYYVIPVYQKYIERGWRVDISIADQMWDMGTPEALKEFVNHLAQNGK